MAELGSEGIVDEVIAYLTTNLATKLTAVDGRYSSQVTPEDMSEWRIDDPLYGKLPNKLPLGWVVAARNTIDQWGSNYDYQNVTLVVWVLIRDQNAETLRQKVYRTMVAIWETLKDGHFDSSISWQMLDSPEIDYSEILTGPNGVLFSDARLRITMFAREDA